MNETNISGIMTLTIWGMDELTGEVESDSEQQFRFILGGVRLH